jgi:outer membrane protein assembly factor BamB
MPATKRETFSENSDNSSVYSYRLKRVFEVEGRQGIATDSQYYYVSGSKTLYKYSMDAKLLLKNEKPFINLDKPANHIGDIDVYNGEIFAGCETFIDGRGINIQIAIYDSKTLRYKRSIDFHPDSGQEEVSGITVDTERKVVWMTDWVDGSNIYQYDLGSGAYIGKLQLQPAPKYQQGIFYRDGKLFITADDGNAEFDEHDHMYRVKIDPSAMATQVTLVKTFTEVKRTGEIEGLTMDPATDELLVLFNRGARIILGMPKGFYPGYDREIHEVYVYDMSKKR